MFSERWPRYGEPSSAPCASPSLVKITEPRDSNGKRSVVIDPLPGGAKPSHVQKVRIEESAAARREEGSIGLGDVAARYQDVFLDRVTHETSPHRPPRDEFKDVVVGAPPKNCFALQI